MKKKELLTAGIITVGLAVGIGIGYRKYKSIVNYEHGINITVRDLKDILKGLPDDMNIIVTSTPEDDPNYISSFMHLTTAGVLKNPYEEKPALCLAPSTDGLDIKSLLDKNGSDTECMKLLF